MNDPAGKPAGPAPSDAGGDRTVTSGAADGPTEDPHRGDAGADAVTDGSGGERVVAAFDFDGTVTRGGSVVGFLVMVAGWRRVATVVAPRVPALARAAVRGGTDADTTKEHLFTRVLAGTPLAEARTLGARFARVHLEKTLRPEVGARIAWHRRRGHRVVLVSASPELYVRPAGEILGVEDVLATRLAVDADDRLTGHYEGRNCRGAEKYVRFEDWVRAAGLVGPDGSRPVLWAYGNSRGDLRLLEAADHGVDVGRLGRFGRLSRFPRLRDVVAGTGPD